MKSTTTLTYNYELSTTNSEPISQNGAHDMISRFISTHDNSQPGIGLSDNDNDDIATGLDMKQSLIGWQVFKTLDQILHSVEDKPRSIFVDFQRIGLLGKKDLQKTNIRLANIDNCKNLVSCDEENSSPLKIHGESSQTYFKCGGSALTKAPKPTEFGQLCNHYLDAKQIDVDIFLSRKELDKGKILGGLKYIENSIPESRKALNGKKSETLDSGRQIPFKVFQLDEVMKDRICEDRFESVQISPDESGAKEMQEGDLLAQNDLSISMIRINEIGKEKFSSTTIGSLKEHEHENKKIGDQTHLSSNIIQGENNKRNEKDGGSDKNMIPGFFEYTNVCTLVHEANEVHKKVSILKNLQKENVNNNDNSSSPSNRDQDERNASEVAKECKVKDSGNDEINSKAKFAQHQETTDLETEKESIDENEIHENRSTVMPQENVFPLLSARQLTVENVKCEEMSEKLSFKKANKLEHIIDDLASTKHAEDTFQKPPVSGNLESMIGLDDNDIEITANVQEEMNDENEVLSETEDMEKSKENNTDNQDTVSTANVQEEMNDENEVLSETEDVEESKGNNTYNQDTVSTANVQEEMNDENEVLSETEDMEESKGNNTYNQDTVSTANVQEEMNDENEVLSETEDMEKPKENKTDNQDTVSTANVQEEMNDENEVLSETEDMEESKENNADNQDTESSNYVPSDDDTISEEFDLFDDVKRIVVEAKLRKDMQAQSKQRKIWHQKWYNRYQDLILFMEKNGHTHVSQCAGNEISLGYWMSVQKAQYKLYCKGQKKKSKLTATQIEALFKLDKEWNLPYHTRSWAKRIEDYSKFLKKYGRDPTTHEDHRLWSWVCMQRSLYKKKLDGEPSSLTAKRIETLNKIGFIWEQKLPNSDYKEPENVSSEEVLQHVNELDVNLENEWHYSPRKKRTVWYLRYLELVAFLQEYGHTNVSMSTGSKSSLGKWLKTQRNDYHQYLQGQGKIKQFFSYRIEALTKLDKDWHIAPYIRTWEIKYRELEEFMKKHGREPQKRDNTTVLHWVALQRSSYRKMKDGEPSNMTSEREERLNKLGFCWNPSKGRRFKIKKKELPPPLEEKYVPAVYPKKTLKGKCTSGNANTDQDEHTLEEHQKFISQGNGFTEETESDEVSEKLIDNSNYQNDETGQHFPGNLQREDAVNAEGDRFSLVGLYHLNHFDPKKNGDKVEDDTLHLKERIQEEATKNGSKNNFDYHNDPTCDNVPDSESSFEGSDEESESDNVERINGATAQCNRYRLKHNEWSRRYRELIAFNKEHGHCYVPTRGRGIHDTKAIRSLGKWFARQRGQYHDLRRGKCKDNPLIPSRIEALNRISKDWHLLPNHRIWKERYEELGKFIEEHGTEPRRHESPSLVEWMTYQRCEYRKLCQGLQSSLTEDRMEKLNGIKFRWNATRKIAGNGKTVHDFKWEQRFEELTEFKGENGHCLVPMDYPENPDLAIWVQKMRMCLRHHLRGERSTYPKERIEALLKIGFEESLKVKEQHKQEKFDAFNRDFEKRFKELLEFKEKAGNLLVPIKYPENQELSKWATKMRCHFRTIQRGKSTSIPASHVDKLREIGFETSLQHRSKQKRKSDEVAIPEGFKRQKRKTN